GRGDGGGDEQRRDAPGSGRAWAKARAVERQCAEVEHRKTLSWRRGRRGSKPLWVTTGQRCHGLVGMGLRIVFCALPTAHKGNSLCGWPRASLAGKSRQRDAPRFGGQGSVWPGRCWLLLIVIMGQVPAHCSGAAEQAASSGASSRSAANTLLTERDAAGRRTSLIDIGAISP